MFGYIIIVGVVLTGIAERCMFVLVHKLSIGREKMADGMMRRFC